jgi:tetratricopeptide (TPR) repeat protein
MNNNNMGRIIFWGITICTLILVGFIGFSIYKAENYEASFVKEVNRNLSPEDRKIYEDRITEAKNKLESEQDPKIRFNLLMNLGSNLHGLGNLTDARKAFEDAIKINENDYNAYVSLHSVQLDQNDISGAEKSIKRALELNRSDRNVWKKYIIFEKDKKGADNDKISSLYSEALNKTGNHIDIVTAYALWLGETGNLQASKEYWQKAIELNPTGRPVYEAEIGKIDAKMNPQ